MPTILFSNPNISSDQSIWTLNIGKRIFRLEKPDAVAIVIHLNIPKLIAQSQRFLKGEDDE